MELKLPFKPFTLDEVVAITGISPSILDKWVGKLLPLYTGEDGISQGLEYTQTFAVFVASKYLHEGSGIDRANAVLLYLSSCSITFLQREVEAGRNFPVPASMVKGPGPKPRKGVMVEAPDTPLGKRLNLAVLLPEFKDALARVFPSYQG